MVISNFVLVLLHLWNKFQVWNNSWMMFSEKQFQSVWGSFTIFQRKKMVKLVGSFCWRFNRDCWICDAHKMLYFCNQNGIVTFCQSCVLVWFLVNTATFERKCRFLSFSVIVTLVGSRDGLVEPLRWLFVIAPLLSYFSKLL